MQKNREMEDPRQWASILMHRLRLDGDKTAHRIAEDVFLDAMNDVLVHAKEAAERERQWAAEAIEALRHKLNHPVS